MTRIVLFMAVGMGGYFTYDLVQPTKPQEFIACMRFGCVYCGEMTQTACGINLRKCADTREYFCVHDLAFKETK